jgi:RPA family protein
MSADEQSGAGRREVAYRVFAAEYNDADFQYTENEADERAPNYVVTPTGARVNRLFLVGVLTEIERVNEEMLRGRIVDPTGAFVVYAGQYQPDALTVLERLDSPAFVAVTGKARTFQPEDADTVYTSVRPESINEVDADTRDRWTVNAARHTLERIATAADALDREERGEELTAVLEADGVDHGLGAGIPLAIDHYGTTSAYLDAVREMAIGAAEVVADRREEAAPLDLDPDGGGHVEVDPAGGPVSVGAGAGDETAEVTPAVGADESTASGDEAVGVSATGDADESSRIEASGPTDESGTLDASGESDAIDEPAETDSEPAETDSEPEETAETIDEMYELDEAERERVETEFGTDFSTGSEIEDPGDADVEPSDSSPETGGSKASDTDEGAIETPSTDSTETGPADHPDADDAGEDHIEPTDEGEESAESDDLEPTDEGEKSAESDDLEPTDAGEESAESDDVDLEDAVVDAMRDLDSGEGAERDAVIEAVSDEHGVDPGEVEDAIQDALMSGTCYEPGDGLLKAI